MDKDAPVIRKSIIDIAKEFETFDFRVVALHRNFRTIIPKGNDRFLPNDQVFVITKPEGNSFVMKLRITSYNVCYTKLLRQVERLGM